MIIPTVTFTIVKSDRIFGRIESQGAAISLPSFFDDTETRSGDGWKISVGSQCSNAYRNVADTPSVLISENANSRVAGSRPRPSPHRAPIAVIGNRFDQTSARFFERGRNKGLVTGLSRASVP